MINPGSILAILMLCLATLIGAESLLGAMITFAVFSLKYFFSTLYIEMVKRNSSALAKITTYLLR